VGPRARILEQCGVVVHRGHHAGNLNTVANGRVLDAVVASSAVPSNNLEYTTALSLGVPVLDRQAFFPWITSEYDLVVAVAGSHGKSTTTAYLAQLLLHLPHHSSLGDSYPAISVTALVAAHVPFVSGPTLGLHLPPHDDHADESRDTLRVLVIEADEYGRALMGLTPDIVVLTAVDWEHVDQFSSAADVENLYVEFCLQRLQPDGVLCYCAADDGCHRVADRVRSAIGMCVPYDKDVLETTRLESVVQAASPNALSVFAAAPYQVLNQAGACVGAAYCLERAVSFGRKDHGNTSIDEYLSVLVPFVPQLSGPRRRLEVLGSWTPKTTPPPPTSHGTDTDSNSTWLSRVTVVDDFAHHPTELRASLEAACKAFDGGVLEAGVTCEIVAVLQPHTYSRLNALWDKFVETLTSFVADAPGARSSHHLWVMDVYGSRETPFDNTSGAAAHSLSLHLVKTIQEHVVVSTNKNNDNSDKEDPTLVIEAVGNVADALGRAPAKVDRVQKGRHLVFLFLGAGDVTDVAHNLARHMKKTSSNVV